MHSLHSSEKWPHIEDTRFEDSEKEYKTCPTIHVDDARKKRQSATSSALLSLYKLALSHGNKRQVAYVPYSKAHKVQSQVHLLLCSLNRRLSVFTLNVSPTLLYSALLSLFLSLSGLSLHYFPSEPTTLPFLVLLLSRCSILHLALPPSSCLLFLVILFVYVLFYTLMRSNSRLHPFVPLIPSARITLRLRSLLTPVDLQRHVKSAERSLKQNRHRNLFLSLRKRNKLSR